MKKILSIDGGGIRGIIPALVLARIEELTSKPAADLFDLIIGTSTGGLLALGLGIRDTTGKPQYSAKQLSELYETRGRDIFQRSLWDGITAGVLDNVYESDGLEHVLQDYFKDAKFKDLPAEPKVAVTTYDIRLRSPLFLKSWHANHQDIRLREAARATSAAPTYFDPLRLEVGGLDSVLVDGGVFINNPSVSGYAEALKEFGRQEDFFMLSLGTGELTRTIPYEQVVGKGKIAWLLPLLSCMFDGVADAADYQMRQILPEAAYFRLQVSLGKRGDPLCANDDMDDATSINIRSLKEIAAKLIWEREGELGRICDALLI